MRQLTGLDSLFLELETRNCPMHVGCLLVLDPRSAAQGLDYDAALRHIEQHLHLVPAFRRRLVHSPLALDRPYWIEDPDFDIEHHVLHRALPAPGSDEQLGVLVADIMRRPLNRDMPLWACHFITGLRRKRVAVVIKMHHACVDGVAGADLLSVLLDHRPDARPEPPPRPWQPDTPPSALRLGWNTARAVAGRPLRLARLLRQSLPAVLNAGSPAGRQADQHPALPAIAPHTRFNRMIGPRRSYAFGSLSLARIRRLRAAAGVSINDVVLCISAGALRHYLQDRGELPGHSLWAGVPVSVRDDEAGGSAGNRVLMARTALHTELADPVERLHAISAQMHTVKQQHGAAPARLMLDWLDVPAPALLIRAARLYENFAMDDLTRLAFNLVISNVPGSRKPLYFAGARLLHNHPVSIPYHGLAFNITVMSYRDRLDFGLTAHRESVPDIWALAALLASGLDELEAGMDLHRNGTGGRQ